MIEQDGASQQETERAAAETTEEEVVVAAEEENVEAQQEPEDNAERSRLGRKVKMLEEQLAREREEQNSKFDAILQKLEARTVEPEDDDEIITTKDLPKYISKYEEEKQKDQRVYENNYIAATLNLGSDLDAAEHEEILKEMEANFNVRHSSNAQRDAEINFLKAERSVLRKRTAGSKKKVNVKGNESGAALGLESGTNMETHLKPLPKLDEAAAAFAKKHNMTEEDIRRALSRTL